jgi:hypothetical protein
MISDNLKKGVSRAPNRSLLKACGYTDEEIERPFIGIVNSFTEVVPGHIHLNTLAEAAKKGVWLIPVSNGLCEMLSTCGVRFFYLGNEPFYAFAERITKVAPLVACLWRSE